MYILPLDLCLKSCCLSVACIHNSGVAEIRATADGTRLHLDHADRGEISPLVETFICASSILRIIRPTLSHASLYKTRKKQNCPSRKVNNYVYVLVYAKGRA